MADTVDARTRSRIMSRIRSRDTGPERQMEALLAETRIPYRYQHKIKGVQVDFFLPGPGTALFVDDCFWHYCPEHGRIPKSNRGFWRPKLERNRERDAEVTERLEAAGYRVVRIWTHDLDGMTPEKLSLTIGGEDA